MKENKAIENEITLWSKMILLNSKVHIFDIGFDSFKQIFISLSTKIKIGRFNLKV